MVLFEAVLILGEIILRAWKKKNKTVQFPGKWRAKKLKSPKAPSTRLSLTVTYSPQASTFLLLPLLELFLTLVFCY